MIIPFFFNFLSLFLYLFISLSFVFVKPDKNAWAETLRDFLKIPKTFFRARYFFQGLLQFIWKVLISVIVLPTIWLLFFMPLWKNFVGRVQPWIAILILIFIFIMDDNEFILDLFFVLFVGFCLFFSIPFRIFGLALECVLRVSCWSCIWIGIGVFGEGSAIVEFGVKFLRDTGNKILNLVTHRCWSYFV